jgi:hypothetical protein
MNAGKGRPWWNFQLGRSHQFPPITPDLYGWPGLQILLLRGLLKKRFQQAAAQVTLIIIVGSTPNGSI